MEFEVQEYCTPSFDKSQVESIARLELAAFPGNRTLEERIQRVASTDCEPNHKRFVIWQYGKAVAAARTFHRAVFVAGGEFNVLALASVCSDPDFRGQGLGRMVVTAAFGDVDNGATDLSLFQTGVPVFYEKLDCKLIENEIVNRKSSKTGSPFDDKHVMICPARFDWPAGTVDLNGEGY